MRRSVDEIVAVCADSDWNYLTVTAQHRSPEDEDGLCSGTDKDMPLPTKDDIKGNMQRIATEDASDDLLGKLERGLTSQALEAAVARMTLAAQRNRKDVIPLEAHVEILQRFIRRCEEWGRLKESRDY